MEETGLNAERDPSGVSPADAFAILGDETRLNIVRVLWKAGAVHEYDDVDDSASTMTYSELRRRVAVDDNGRFNYHLSKLVPSFVRKTPEGYRLSSGGKRIARTVVALAGDHDTEDLGEVNTPCPACGAAIRATYEDQWLRFSCTECDGLFGDSAPGGTLLNAPMPPAGLVGRTPDEALATELYRCMLDLTYLMGGVCCECAGTVGRSLSTCAEHGATPDEPCPACGTAFAAWGELRCETCRFAKRLPVELCVMGLTPVVGFLSRRDVDVLAPSLDGLFELVRTGITTSITGNPRRVVTTIDGGEDVLTLTLDEHLAVVDVSH